MTKSLVATVLRSRVGSALLGAFATTLLWAPQAKAATTITQSTCPILITQPGEYDLETDVTCLAPGVDGIDITASKVTLHLDGHTITGSGTCDNAGGIHVLNPLVMLTLVHILGPGTITNFENGVVGENSAGSYVKFTTINQQQCATSNGILIISPSSQWKAESNTVTGISQSPGALGINLTGVNDSDLVLNTVNDSILLSNGSSNNIIDNNTANGNIDGIELQSGSNNNEIHANTTDNNSNIGIAVDSGATSNDITGNAALGNTIDLTDGNANCDHNKWRGNKFNVAFPSTCIH